MRSSSESPLFGTPEYFRRIDDSNRRLVRAVSKRAARAEWSLPQAFWREARIVGTAAAGMTLVVWIVRITSQLFDLRWLNESILSGHWNDYIRDVETGIDVADRTRGG